MAKPPHIATEEVPTTPDDSRPPTVPTRRGTGGSLTKVTVNLIPRAYEALDEHTETSGETKTEAINRAIQMYAWISERLRAGETLVVLDKFGKAREIQVF